MAPLLVKSGAYQSAATIANNQRCINLYPEVNPADTKPPVPVTHYQRPGKIILGSPAFPGAARGLYTATNGDLFAVIGSAVYFINAGWNFIQIGNIAPGTNPTSMADNGKMSGNRIVLVDGTSLGYQIDMTTYLFSQIVDGTGLFTGADIVQYLQTFFLFNKLPQSQNWITSLSNQVAFNALDIAAKSNYADSIVTIGLRQREPWLIGTQTTEPWFLSGGADFQFEAVPSTFVPYGSAAKHGITNADTEIFWVSRNIDGKGMIVKSEGYAAVRISTYAIEQELNAMATIEDAVATSFQINGHIFAVWHFISGNKTYAYDLGTKQWCQFVWTDENGVLNRDRALLYAAAYGKVVALDWENGVLYEINDKVYNDFGGPITFMRGFPHVINEMKRVTHWAAVVDVQCGEIQDPNAPEPTLNLRYSDDRGKTWSDWIEMPMGLTGEYDTSPQVTNLGEARDRVYEIMYSVDALAPFNGLYVETEESET